MRRIIENAARFSRWEKLSAELTDEGVGLYSERP
jgi:hypothetical protein